MSLQLTDDEVHLRDQCAIAVLAGLGSWAPLDSSPMRGYHQRRAEFALDAANQMIRTLKDTKLT